MSETIVSNILPVTKFDRFEVLDIAKGIGILFVIFAHVNYTPAILTYIYSFHMPLFFIISGMLFNRDKYTGFFQFFKRRVKTLILPYIFFYIFSLAVMFILRGVSEGFSNVLLGEMYDSFFQMFLSQGSERCLNAPLWFVPCLFAVEIMYCFISKLRDKYNICIILISSVVTFVGWLLESEYLPFDNALLPWSLDSAMFAVGFYALGNLTYDKVKYTVNKVSCNKHKNFIAVLVVILCVVSLIPFVFLNGKISMGSKVLNNGFMVYASGIIGTVGVVFASVLLLKSKFLKICGLNSFYIMSTHYIIRIMYQSVCSFTGFMMYDSRIFVETIIPFIVVAALSIGFSVLYSKFKNGICSKN